MSTAALVRESATSTRGGGVGVVLDITNSQIRLKKKIWFGFLGGIFCLLLFLFSTKF